MEPSSRTCKWLGCSLPVPSLTAWRTSTPLSHAFGVHGPIRNNAEFVSENTLVHPVGHHVALYHIEDREMQFLQKNRNVRGILALSVAPKRHVVAVCEALSTENSNMAQVSIFHVGTRNRMRTMTVTSAEFTSCCFTQDSKFLVTQGRYSLRAARGTASSQTAPAHLHWRRWRSNLFTA